MGYDTAQLVQEALDAGFSQAGELNLKAVVFMPEVRDMCSADRCRQYGKNWRCPPACGSIEDAAARASRYSYGLLVQTVGQMEDEFDYETIQETSKKHQANFAALVKRLKARYDDLLPMGAGTCTLCQTCTYPDAPCRFPEDSISSMEAYGLWVSKVCELSGVPYYHGKDTITYTSCYLLQ
jgi:predicted metal-binding protein